MRTLVMCSAVALIAALGCKKEEKPSGGSTGVGSGGSAGVASGSAGAGSSAGSGAATAPAGTVELFINDSSVAKVAPGQIQAWPRVDTLVPEDARRLGTWLKVKLVGAKTEELTRPSQSYPELVPVLFPGEGGKPTFGMFEPAEHANKGQPKLRADDLREVRIQLATEGRMGEHQNAGEARDPTKAVIEIETPAGKSQLTGAQILALPREPQPGSEDTRGWRLAQLLEAAGIKKFERLVLGDESGSSLVIERKDVSAKTVPFIKLNKQGAFRVRVLKQQGTGWPASGELRSLVSIKVAK